MGNIIFKPVGGGAAQTYSGNAIVIKDAATPPVLHFFPASAEAEISISGPSTVAADAGTAQYAVSGATGLGVTFTWAVVTGAGDLAWSINDGVLTLPLGVAAGNGCTVQLKFGDAVIAEKAVTVTGIAIPEYAVTIPSVTGVTLTVKHDGTALQSGNTVPGGDSIVITAAAVSGYTVTAVTASVGGGAAQDIKAAALGDGAEIIVTGVVAITATAQSNAPQGEMTTNEKNEYAFIFKNEFTDDYVEVEYSLTGSSGNNSNLSHFKATRGTQYWHLTGTKIGGQPVDCEINVTINDKTWTLPSKDTNQNPLYISGSEFEMTARKKISGGGA